jgi:F-type H+-transporting ATPase subunit gamma
MSRHLELKRLGESLADIGELIGAIRNIALVESRRIQSFIQAQDAATAMVEAAYADFTQDHAHWLQNAQTIEEVWCVIGSERGFCGDLNRQLTQTLDATPPNERATIVLVGQQLAQGWQGPSAAQLPGARFADEVRQVLHSLVATLGPLLHSRPQGIVGLSLIYPGEHGPQQRRVLPVPQPHIKAPRRASPIKLWLPPADYLHALLEEWIAHALTDALYDALLHENQRRLEHMEQARRRIDERLEELGRQENRARQDEITEEIEVILLAAQSALAPYGAT